MTDSRKFVWYELMTTDTEGAQDFYSKLIGWGLQSFENSDMDYTMWTVAEQPIGGLMELPDEARAGGTPPHWLAYVGVPDLAGSVTRANELGACTLVEPTEIPGAGAFSVLADPQGAIFALYSSGEEQAEGAAGGQGHVSWLELATTDLEEGFSFYKKLFGWACQQDMDMGPEGIYRIYGPADGAPLGGMFTKPSAMPGPPGWLIYITVDDLDGCLARLSELGGQVLNGPMDVPGGDRIAQCLDPQGAAFALHWKNPEAPSA